MNTQSRSPSTGRVPITDWADRLSRAIDQRGFASGDDDPIRDFMATYFEQDDWNTRAQVADFLARIIRQAVSRG